jgi:hypothetical protein
MMTETIPIKDDTRMKKPEEYRGRFGRGDGCGSETDGTDSAGVGTGSGSIPSPEPLNNEDVSSGSDIRLGEVSVDVYKRKTE